MFDSHAHTSLSYCADPDLTPQAYVELLASRPELTGVAVTNHGMAVYFPREVAWSWTFLSDSRIFDAWRDHGNERLAAHLGELAEFAASGLVAGLEVEMMHDGRLTLDPAMRSRLRLLVGSVHSLPETVGRPPTIVLEQWERHVYRLLETGIEVLAHPFRWLVDRVPVSSTLIREVVAAAGRNGVAVELNGHCHIATDVEMLRVAAELGVMVAFGTDAHRLDEVGDCRYHLATLAAAGLSLAELRVLTVPGLRAPR